MDDRGPESSGDESKESREIKERGGGFWEPWVGYLSLLVGVLENVKVVLRLYN
jgi:hypothetical protein